MAVAPTFPLFPSLPPELRSYIWSYTFPPTDGPAVYFYKRGCWCQRHFLPTEKSYNASEPLNWALEFRHDLLEKIRVKMPHNLVNLEARSAMLHWIREKDFEIQSIDERTLFLRRIDPVHDIMYVRLEDIWDFRLEQSERLLQPEVRFHTVIVLRAQTQCVAIAEAMLRNAEELLREIYQFFISVRVIYVIPDMGPEIRPEEMTRSRWELESGPDVRYTWDAEVEHFRWEGSAEGIRRELCELIESTGEAVRETLFMRNVQKFHIQPATISRA